MLPSDGNSQLFHSNEWSASQHYPMKNLYEDNCYLQESEGKGYYMYANDENSYGNNVPDNQQVSEYISIGPVQTLRNASKVGGG